MRIRLALAVLGAAAALVGAGVAAHAHAQAPQPACVVGMPGTGTNIEVDGTGADAARDCDGLLTSSFNSQQYQRLASPSGSVMCRYQVGAAQYTVRDRSSTASTLTRFYCWAYSQDGGSRKLGGPL